VYAATRRLNSEALHQNPQLPPAVYLRDQEGKSWDDVSIARFNFCMTFQPQLPFLSIARFVYADGGQSTIRRIQNYKDFTQKKLILGVAPRKSKKIKVLKEEEEGEEEKYDEEKDYDNEDDDDDKEEVQLPDSRKRKIS